MKLNELNYPRNSIKNSESYDHADILKGLGFKHHGSGSYASVHIHPSLNYVMKVFQARDKCYRKFYELAILHQNNPHFPQFRGKMMRITNAVYAVRMEKLSDQSPLSGFDMHTLIAKIRFTVNGRSFPKDLEEKFPMLKEACKLLKDNMSGCENDLYESNIMWRGEIPVITDPYYDPKTL